MPSRRMLAGSMTLSSEVLFNIFVNFYAMKLNHLPYRPTGFSAGTDHVTLADLAFVASYTTLLETGVVDVSPYSELPAWLERVKKEIPNYEKANGEGVKKLGELFKSKAQEIGL